MVMLSLLFFAVPVLSTATHSATELAILKQGINSLKGILSDTLLGSGRLFAGNGWQSRNFAEYTAGSLAEKGYATQLVSQAGWSDGVHTWVLVGVSLGGGTA